MFLFNKSEGSYSSECLMERLHSKEHRTEESLKKESIQNFWTHPCFDSNTTNEYNRNGIAIKYKNESSFARKYLCLYADAKTGDMEEHQTLAQIILAIGKERLLSPTPLPPFLGCFNTDKYCFIELHDIQDLFYSDSIDWKVSPSDHSTASFQFVLSELHKRNDKPKSIIKTFINANEIKIFIHDAFIANVFDVNESNDSITIPITKNNYIEAFKDFERYCKEAINFDFNKTYYLKKELSTQNNKIELYDFFVSILQPISINQSVSQYNLNVFYNKLNEHFEIKEQLYNENKQTCFNLNEDFSKIEYDKEQFSHYFKTWNTLISNDDYNYILNNQRYLQRHLDSNNNRAQTGSFYTPQIWVDKAHEYLNTYFKEQGVNDWQDEYYVWDNCCGTGNLLKCLSNENNIWASTLEQTDIDLIHEQIKTNGRFNLLLDHVFQFDFLNDDFNKLPIQLQNIINDPDKRKRLVILINPPYKGSTGEEQEAVFKTKTYYKYKHQAPNAIVELETQFFYRIYKEITGCVIAEFSKISILSSSRHREYRKIFQAKLEKMFICNSISFFNVKGSFPIGFKIWDTKKQEVFEQIKADVFDENKQFSKLITCNDSIPGLRNWIALYKSEEPGIGALRGVGTDVYNNKKVCLYNSKKEFESHFRLTVTKENLYQAAAFMSVQRCITGTWINDKDVFYTPIKEWNNDVIFKNNCLVYMLFDNQNVIKSDEINNHTNHFIPYSEQQVYDHASHCIPFIDQQSQQQKNNAYPKFKSSLMYDFLKSMPPDQFSVEAQNVLSVGLEVYRYYHANYKNNENYKDNASLYEMRGDVRGYDEKDGKKYMRKTSQNDTSFDEIYKTLQQTHKALGETIKPKVYQYGFLRSEEYPIPKDAIIEQPQVVTNQFCLFPK